MCGVAGIVDFRARPAPSAETVERMCALIAHRGPDDQGVHAAGRAVLGHRRLAITDLVSGRQPLANEDGSVWVVFNGEIYNYRALRSKLEARGHRFATRTDTEIIPHLYEECGDDFVLEMEGNWAIALWDERRSRLVVTRDRVGKKPLVWTASDGVVRFASEAKALFADVAVPREPDPRGLADVIHYGFVTGTRTMFRGISTVPPATVLVFERGVLVSERRYWDIAGAAEYEGDVEHALDEFTELFSAVTRERLMGDVPYGLMLSGGIDSGLAASFVSEHEPSLRTYTIARGDRDDESAQAALLARHVGSDHHVLELASADVAAIAARIPWMFDQPFFNDASIANYLFAQSVAGELTVAITGDGGDDGFSGTLRHLGDELASTIARAPRPLVEAGVRATDLAGRAVGLRRPLRRAGLLMRAARVDDRRRWLSLHQQHLPIRHRTLLETPAWRRADGYDPEDFPLSCYDRCRSRDHLNRVLYAEAAFQLPSNDLLKVDRAFMYNGVAGRAPFLDRRVVEFAASLPASWKHCGRTFKWFLRELARRRLPAELVDRRKVGLAVPLREWLRGPLGEKVARVVRSESFARRGIFDPAGARRALDEHRDGRADYGYTLWTMALTELWYRSFVDTFAEPDERIWE